MALVYALAFVGGAGAAMAASVCDPAFVTQQGGLFTVLPTGINDTANLQCAFDAAVIAGPGSEVRLLPGAYHTAQIVVNEWCVTAGGHCRTGLEDNVKFDPTRLAASNAELVKKIADVCEQYGRHVASPAEARQLLGLAPVAAIH